MTREEAIAQLKDNRVLCVDSETEPFAIAYDMAIKALEQEPCEDAISRQKALNAITMAEVRWQAIDNINKLPPVTPTQKSETVTEFADRCRECGAKYNKLLKEKSWIPVSERLPKEENKSYWICTDSGYQCECRWTNVNPFWTDLTTDWHWHHMDVPSYQKVVAWMPLPEPYKAESEVEK